MSTSGTNTFPSYYPFAGLPVSSINNSGNISLTNLTNGGLIHQTNYNQNYGNYNSGDGFYPLTEYLTRNRPYEKIVHDASYHIEFDMLLPQARFHLLSWRESENILPEKFWQVIDLDFVNASHPFSLNGNLSFFSKKTRKEFLCWWKNYTNKFFEGIPPLNLFLPTLKPGKFSGVFIEHQTDLDNLPYSSLNNNNSIISANSYSMATSLIEVLPVWGWIIDNCRKPVYRQHGGWFFSSETDAAKFKLFDPVKKNIEVI